MPRVVHFEIHGTQPELLVEFYSQVFGWSITKWDGPIDYWLVTTGDDSEAGINGGILKRRGPTPGDGSPVISAVTTVDVPSLEEFVATATTAGASLAVPKMPVPGVGWLAYMKDPDGNLFGMMQRDPTAK